MKFLGKHGTKSIDFCLNCGYYEHAKVTAPYLAPYQVVNSSLALLAMDVIDPKQEISQDLRIRAIKETKWQGRMETGSAGCDRGWGHTMRMVSHSL